MEPLASLACLALEGKEFESFIYMYTGLMPNMLFSSPLRRSYLLILLVVAIVGCQSIADTVYEEKGSLVGRMSVPEIEDALQVCPLYFPPLYGFTNDNWNLCTLTIVPLQQCPLVQDLNRHKLATSPQTSGLTTRIFAVLFPGSPAVNALLATLYISGPPSKLISFPTMYEYSSRLLIQTSSSRYAPQISILPPSR